MKKIKWFGIKKICWKKSVDSEEICVVGFVVKETEKQIHIASTKNVNGFSDDFKINKNDITSSFDLSI